MRQSLEEGLVPEDWRTANVTPVFKKGAKTDPGNYRPVSLTSVSCRLMESIVKDDIVAHLEKYKLIRTSQHGFMRGKLCTSNLLSFFEDVTREADKGESIDIIYLDFAKAFDKVPTARLMKKLKAHGVSGYLLKWIAAWLTNRRQRVVLNGKQSSWEAVLSGVPQGSVLGPLLFIIFINDLDQEAGLAVWLCKFADDTKMVKVIRSESDRQELQNALDRLVVWARKWGKAFNISKCKVMHIGRANKHFPYTMAGKVLTVTNEERDLGVVVSDKLKPAAQCAQAARTAQAVLGQIARAFQYRTRTTFIQLYK
jgi:hypothetical protein